MRNLSIGGSEEKADDEDLLGSNDVDAKDDSLLSRPSSNTFGQTSAKAKHNAALDPSSPVHITLPTFRMLVLADETLEAFFDSGFANSFHLADAPLPSSTITSPSFLNLQSAPANAVPPTALGPGAGPVAGEGVGVVPPGKGLRGMLDNIVTDGMRVAAEVRRRMDDAQRELDKGASTRGTGEEDEDEDEEGQGEDLLMGAEADAGAASMSVSSGKSGHGSSTSGREGMGAGAGGSLLDRPLQEEPVSGPPPPKPGNVASGEKSTMFER